MKLKFRELNPMIVGILGVGVTLLVLVGSFQVAALPMVAGTTYTALFSEAGGLKSGDKVTVSGTEVGEVTDVLLAGPHVAVTFTAKDVVLGDQTRAEIKTQTLLGERNLGVLPAGSGELSGDDAIPVERTKAPYSITQSIEDLTRRTGEIDSNKVSQALDAFSQAFQNTPDEIGPAFDGITRLSRTIASRDQALRTLLHRAEAVTGILRDHTGQLTQVVQDGTQLLGELQARRDAIHRLLTTATKAANQAAGFVSEQRGILTPALNELNGAVAVLRRNEGNVATAIRRVASYIGGLGEGLSSSPQFNGVADVGALPPTLFPTADFIPRLAMPGGQSPAPQTPNLPSVGGLLGMGGQ